jgi:hypothetical protein
MSLLPIVEGHAETESIPVLLRRLGVDCLRPFRVKRNRVVKPGELERALEQAVRDREGATAILVLLDADDDCPKEDAPGLLARAKAATPLPVSFVFAMRELEAWFLGGIESLRGQRGIRDNATYDADPEERRGAKEQVEALMINRTYLDTDDQPALMAKVDVQAARQRCSSLDKLLRDLKNLGLMP